MNSDWDATAKICGNCRFWSMSGYDEERWDFGVFYDYPPTEPGSCRRHSPAVKGGGDAYSAGNPIWPKTWHGAWCGDFEQRPGYVAAPREDWSIIEEGTTDEHGI